MSKILYSFVGVLICCQHGVDRCEAGDAYIRNAISQGRLDILEWLLKQDVDIDAQDSTGYTALMYAATSTHPNITSYLLNKGADPLVKNNQSKTALLLSVEEGLFDSVRMLYNVSGPGEQDVNGKTALHLAVSSNHQDIAGFLLDEGMDPYTKDNNGLTIIHLAAMSGQLPLIQDFKRREYDLEIASHNGTTPLILAALFDHYEVTKYLIESGVKVSTKDANSWNSLHAAAYSGNLDIIRLLVEKKLNVNEKTSEGKTPLFLSVEKGHADAVRYFIQIGCNVFVRDNLKNSLLHQASAQGNIEIINFLLKKLNLNSDNDFGWTPIISAAMNNQTDAVRSLIEAGCNVNYITPSGQSLLSYAASTGNVNLIQLIHSTSKHIDYSSTNFKNQSLLHFAAESGSSSAVNLIIQLMADKFSREKREVNFKNWKFYKTVTNQVDSEGKTALYYAAEKGHAVVVQEILRFGGDCRVSTLTGDTAFHVASRNKNMDCLGVFIMNNFEVINSRDTRGQTALFQAVQDGNIESIEFLVQSGADKDVTDNNNQTLLHVAADTGNSKVISYLIANKYRTDLINAEDSKGRSPLWYAVNKKHENVSHMLVSQLGAEIIPKIDILQALKKSKLNEIKNWLKDNHLCQASDWIAEQNQGKSFIHLTVESDDPISILSEIFKYSCFIDRINNNNSFDKTAAWYAASLGKYDTLRYIESFGGVIRPNMSIADAVESGNTTQVKFLLERGADVNTRHSSGPTILFRAAANGYYDTAKLLINNGADLEALYFAENTTALHIAAFRKRCNIVKLLLDSGAKVNPINRFNKTPLDLSQSIQCTDILKQHGAISNNP